MNTKQNLIDVYKQLSVDEQLIRLLDERAVGQTDEALGILAKVLVPMDKVFDLDTEPINRICMYLGNRTPQRNSYFSHDQDFVFDIYVHYTFEELDLRLSLIRDTLDKLIFNEKITGAGKVHFVMGHIITNAPTRWIGYKMVYKFIGLED